jgi:hypothetical protein
MRQRRACGIRDLPDRVEASSGVATWRVVLTRKTVRSWLFPSATMERIHESVAAAAGGGPRMADDKALRDLANASGYLFQLAVEHAIRSHPTDVGWSVLAREHPWTDAGTGESGYADLILGSSTFPVVRIVIECKRVRDGTWLFLGEGHEQRTRRMCCRWVCRKQESRETAGWDDLAISPESPQAAFCAVRGSGERDSPFLERIARRLLAATESIAGVELALLRARSDAQFLVFLPVIVTTAQLATCTVSSEHISLARGSIPEGNAVYSDVTRIRFRKSLSAELPALEGVKSLPQVNRALERTVLVLGAEGLMDFLDGFRVATAEKYGPWPWDRT